MAIDPIQSITFEARDTAVDVDVRSALRRIAALPTSTQAPYISAAIDWRPDGTQPNARPGRAEAQRRLDEIVNSVGAVEEPIVDRARRRIMEHLHGVEPSVQGLFIVAGGELDAFEAISLGLPIATEITTSAAPALRVLTQMTEDNPTYATLVVDQREANLFVIGQSVVAAAKRMEGDDDPRHQQQGGWSQRRYQARADERIAAFVRTVADETRRTLERSGIEMLIVAGGEVAVSALRAEWHPTMRERIVATMQLDIRSSAAQVIDATRPIIERAAREREAAAVDLLVNNVGGPMAVGGAEQTLLALEEGRVLNLVLREDFHADGWVDYSMPIAGVGRLHRRHPAGGDPANVAAVAIEEEMIRLALAQDASIELVRAVRPIGEMADGYVPDAGDGPPMTDAAAKLDAIGGVGAILRYAIVDSSDATS